MRIFIRTLQIIVGVLFVVSGLVKANDPLGLGYKMQEFFELWSSSLSQGHFFLKGILIPLFEFLHQHSLFLAVAMITLEIVAGIALLTGWRKNFITGLLLTLIIFFTFLTGYAYLSGKFTNCGCFGDCLPITPLTSFVKDVVLLLMILGLVLGRKYIMPVFTSRGRSIVMAASLLISLGIQWYALNYLPLADCLPFRKGNNLSQQMKPPPGSIPDSFAIRFIYEKEGKHFEFTPETLPADLGSYHYVDRVDKMIRKGNAEPAIKGFSLTGKSGEDSVNTVLSQPSAVLLFLLDPGDGKWVNDFKDVTRISHKNQIPVYVATATADTVMQIMEQNKIDAQVFSCDFTIIRTAARTNPALYLLQNGTIFHKYGNRVLKNAIPDIEHMTVRNPAQSAESNPK